MKVSKELDDVLRQASAEVDAWPKWKRSLDPIGNRHTVFNCVPCGGGTCKNDSSGVKNGDNEMSKAKEVKLGDALIRAAGKYLDAIGGKALVGGPCSIIQFPMSTETDFYVAVKITGRKPKP